MSISTYTEDRLLEIEAALQCPVCFVIPRDLPISSCPSGHIICQSCRPRVRSCPTCRQSLPADSTNSVVASLIEQVNHECQFRDQGCEARMLLRDLELHESKCPERTIVCPYDDCDQIVQFKDFSIHAGEHSFEACHGPMCNGCTIHTYRMEGCPDWFKEKPWLSSTPSLLLTCSRSGTEQIYLIVEKVREGEKKKIFFVFSVWTGRDEECASMYQANLKIGNLGNELVTIRGLLISSVENVRFPSRDEYDDGKYFFWVPKANIKDVETLIAIVTIERCD